MLYATWIQCPNEVQHDNLKKIMCEWVLKVHKRNLLKKSMVWRGINIGEIDDISRCLTVIKAESQAYKVPRIVAKRYK